MVWLKIVQIGFVLPYNASLPSRNHLTTIKRFRYASPDYRIVPNNIILHGECSIRLRAS